MKKLFVTLFILSACSAQSPTTPAVEPAQTSSAPTGDVSRMVNYGPTEGYLAMPEGEGPFPALVLIHEWWGLNDGIKAYADEFAAEGYIALAVDLYEGDVTDDPAVARELAGAVREDQDRAFENLNQAVAFLRTGTKVDQDKFASVGWCFGGGWSYEMAKNDLGVDSSVIYYGQFNPEDDLSIMSTTIQGHFGEDDELIPVDDVKAFQAKLQTLNGEHEVFIYENQGHGFARELTSPAATTAWERTLDFLDSSL